MNAVEKYIFFLDTQKRYSKRTVTIYSDVLEDFFRFVRDGRSDNISVSALSDADIVKSLATNIIRAYQMELMDARSMSPRTVNQHLSVLSGLCRHMAKQGLLKKNPASLVTRPKQPKRLPVFYKESAMEKYLEADNALRRRDFDLDLRTEGERIDTYKLCLQRIIVCLLYSTGMRRAELIGLKRGNIDSGRGVLRVWGKGDKMREIPLVPSLIEEILLYLQSVDKLVAGRLDISVGTETPLLLTWSGAPVYPVLVDRAVKAELGAMGRSFNGRKSPHVLRHTFATGLMEEGADINSIKEVLGHANLAATQIYTHSSARQLKAVYEAAHPRAAAPSEGTGRHMDGDGTRSGNR